jgi:hypothetical protein
MKGRFVLAGVVAVTFCLLFAGSASATSRSTIKAILKDAQDGHIDGPWTRTQVRSALAYHENLTLGQHGDLDGVLEAFLGSTAADTSGQATAGNLASTGANETFALGIGLALVGAGLALRLVERAYLGDGHGWRGRWHE